MTRIKVRFALGSEREQEKALLDAFVVRRQSDGLAVEWCEFAPTSIRALIRAARAADLGLDPRFITQGSEHSGNVPVPGRQKR
jgi:hypothetical protein